MTAKKLKDTSVGKRKAPARIRRRRSLVIDVHTHIRIPAVEEFVKQNPVKGKGPGKQLWTATSSAAFQARQAKQIRPKHTNPAERLKDMDKMGVDIQGLSMNLPQSCYWANGKKGLEVARACNDGVAEFVATNPDRLLGDLDADGRQVFLAENRMDKGANEAGLPDAESTQQTDFFLEL